MMLDGIGKVMLSIWFHLASSSGMNIVHQYGQNAFVESLMDMDIK